MRPPRYVYLGYPNRYCCLQDRAGAAHTRKDGARGRVAPDSPGYKRHGTGESSFMLTHGFHCPKGPPRFNLGCVPIGGLGLSLHRFFGLLQVIKQAQEERNRRLDLAKQLNHEVRRLKDVVDSYRGEIGESSRSSQLKPQGFVRKSSGKGNKEK